MISVTYSIDGITKTETFSRTKAGQSKSIRFIQQLHDERKKHGWYFNLEKIKRLRGKLDDRKLGQRTKKRYGLESELLKAERERNEFLQKNGITAAPGTLVININ